APICQVPSISPSSKVSTTSAESPSTTARARAAVVLEIDLRFPLREPEIRVQRGRVSRIDDDVGVAGVNNQRSRGPDQLWFTNERDLELSSKSVKTRWCAGADGLGYENAWRFVDFVKGCNGQ